MSETAERVPAACPGCGDETVHEVLSPGGHATVRCTECSHTHKTELTEPTTETVDVVVSQDGESWPATVEREPDEPIYAGEEFIVETAEAIQQVQVTTIETSDDRVDRAEPSDAETVWTRVVDNVGVNVTINPNDGSEERSRSIKLYVPGEFEFTVGNTREAADEEFEVTAIHLRDDADGYPTGTLSEPGDTAFAKHVKRLYGRDQQTSAWMGW